MLVAWPRSRKLAAAGCAAAASAALLLLVLPAYTGSTGNASEHASTLQVEGTGVLVVLFLPVFVAAVPLLVAERQYRVAVPITAAMHERARSTCTSTSTSSIPLRGAPTSTRHREGHR